MKTYSQVVTIFQGLINNGNGTKEEAILAIDNSISLLGMFNAAKGVGALDENGSCEDFSIAHMTAYNNLTGSSKY